MIIDYNNFNKIYKVLDNKYQTTIEIDNFLLNKHIEKILLSINKSKNKPTKIFKHNTKIIKTEFNKFNDLHINLKKLIEEIFSRRFIKILEKIFKIKKLYPDKTNLYSGLNISNKGSKLKEHIDFNFNKTLKKYRCINLLLYLNKNYKKKNGGFFYIRDHFSKKKISIKPKLNKAVIFKTDSYNSHGFTKINSSRRVSLNMYFYTTKNLSKSKQKHKTLWK